MTTKPYRPSNGTEGMIFMEAFCDRCARDAKFRETGEGEDGCPILAATYRYNMEDPRYPKEWVQDEGDFHSARCTAFEAEDSASKKGTAVK